jgi:predicted Ser/Thr protein kinase
MHFVRGEQQNQQARVTFSGICLCERYMSEADQSQSMEKKCPQCGNPLPSGVLEGLCPACLLKAGVADTAAPPESAFEPPSVEEVAKLFPQLEIIALLGKGGMGAVYKARQPSLDRIVALKILPPQTAGGPGFVERFNREARALAKLTHPNIVAVHEFGQTNGLLFFIMEFVDGLNLRELERAGQLSPKEALQIVPQICEALQFAHDEGIVHRDIKPENILVDKRGRVKIADFGIAKILGREQEPALTETRGAIGTPHYMAPEQLEEPTSVDHRADIFSLGVVFYEMLTGELPLGNFRPPSTRKVEVDVRLDQVVLRALEKDPELRYQQASQVKTAVDTIASTSAPPPAPNSEQLAAEILARDFTVNIKSCFRRAWALLRKDFWPLIGVTALVVALVAVAGSAGALLGTPPPHDGFAPGTSVLMILVYGPLMGGLSLYYLKRIRGEPANIEVVFCGFSNRFLHLFLAGFVTWALTALGFVCLILPGIYLLVAWWFTLTLVIDKRMEFWPAMELGRKVVTRHWWIFFGFYLLVLLTFALGVLALVIGIFVTVPLGMIAATYAYEDIFGATSTIVTSSASPGVGPSGTIVMPKAPPHPAASGSGGGRKIPWPGIALGVAVLALAIIFISTAVHQHHRMERIGTDFTQTAVDSESEQRQNSAEAAAPLAFGPVIALDIQARSSGTNEFLDLDNDKLLTPSPEVQTNLTAGQPGEDEARFWEALDIPEGSRRYQYVAWLRESGADLMYAGDGRIIAFDGIFPVAHGDSSTNWNDWSSLTPDSVRSAVDVVDWSRRATAAQLRGQPPPPAPNAGRIYGSAAQLDSRESGGPTVNLLTQDQSTLWYFKTREGSLGVLQLLGFSDNRRVARIRYRLVQNASDEASTSPANRNKSVRESLEERLDAASAMNDMNARDRALSGVAAGAADSGFLDIVQNALRQISIYNTRNDAAREAAQRLARHGFRKEAIEIAKGIEDMNTRDRMLEELAR